MLSFCKQHFQIHFGDWQLPYFYQNFTEFFLKDQLSKPTLVQGMVCCVTAISHYLNQYWPKFVKPRDITRPKWPSTWYGSTFCIWTQIPSRCHSSSVEYKVALIVVMAFHWKVTGHHLNYWWCSSLMLMCRQVSFLYILLHVRYWYRCTVNSGKIFQR